MCMLTAQASRNIVDTFAQKSAVERRVKELQAEAYDPKHE